jgi:hypothetical protein
MRFVLITLFVFFAASLSAQVEVIFDKAEWHKGESIHFVLKSSTQETLEITVFTEGHLLLHQNTRIIGEMPFDIETKEAVTGKYFILVTGEGIHIEKEFQIFN